MRNGSYKVGDIVDLPEYWGARVVAVRKDGRRVKCEWYHPATGETLRYWYDVSTIIRQR